MIIKVDFVSENSALATFPISEERARIVQYKRFDESWAKEKTFTVNLKDGLRASKVVVDE